MKKSFKNLKNMCNGLIIPVDVALSKKIGLLPSLFFSYYILNIEICGSLIREQRLIDFFDFIPEQEILKAVKTLKEKHNFDMYGDYSEIPDEFIEIVRG